MPTSIHVKSATNMTEHKSTKKEYSIRWRPLEQGALVRSGTGQSQASDGHATEMDSSSRDRAGTRRRENDSSERDHTADVS